MTASRGRGPHPLRNKRSQGRHSLPLPVRIARAGCLLLPEGKSARVDCLPLSERTAKAEHLPLLESHSQGKPPPTPRKDSQGKPPLIPKWLYMYKLFSPKT